MDEREIRYSVDNAFDCIPMQWDAFYLNGLRKNVERNNESGKVENQTLGKH
jgi:hypothetical protein